MESKSLFKFSLLLFSLVAKVSSLQFELLNEGINPFILMSDSMNQSIYYTPFKRFTNVEGNTSTPFTGTGSIFPLVTGLPYKPSAMEFCFKMQILYVCAADQGYIFAYKIILNDNASSMAEKVVFNPNYYRLKLIDLDTNFPLNCSGSPAGSSLKLDKFGNLLFVESSKKAIKRVPSSTLDKILNLQARPSMEKFSSEVYCDTLYSVNTTKYLYNLEGITLERDYLYWSNSHRFDSINTPVAKAFSEPFIKKVPL